MQHASSVPFSVSPLVGFLVRFRFLLRPQLLTRI